MRRTQLPVAQDCAGGPPPRDGRPFFTSSLPEAPSWGSTSRRPLMKGGLAAHGRRAGACAPSGNHDAARGRGKLCRSLDPAGERVQWPVGERLALQGTKRRNGLTVCYRRPWKEAGGCAILRGRWEGSGARGACAIDAGTAWSAGPVAGAVEAGAGEAHHRPGEVPRESLAERRARARGLGASSRNSFAGRRGDGCLVETERRHQRC